MSMRNAWQAVVGGTLIAMIADRITQAWSKRKKAELGLT